MGYIEEPIDKITLNFQNGVYDYEKLDVICLPTDSIQQGIDDISEDTLQGIALGTNSVSGSIELDSPKILALAIPYSTGWKAYVDGKEAPLKRANILYMALELSEGEHEILLKYHTPGLLAGLLLTLLGVILLILEKKLLSLKQPS